MTGGKRCFLYFYLTQVLLLSGCMGNRPPNLGQFAPCPESPNCVSTRSTDEKHLMDPIAYAGNKRLAKERLLKIIHSLPRIQVITDTQDYLHVEFTSRIFRFVDDAEFYLAIEDKRIHFRSASRLGYSDLGANRKRMEALRSRFISPDRQSTMNLAP